MNKKWYNYVGLVMLFICGVFTTDLRSMIVVVVAVIGTAVWLFPEYEHSAGRQ